MILESIILESSILICFSDLIFLTLLILKELSSLCYFLGVFVKVTLRFSSNLGFGSFTAKNLSTLGHLIGSKS